MDGRAVITHLLDTCALLDLAADRWAAAAAKRELARAGRPALLCVSVWEIARKARVGKLALPCRQEEILSFVTELCAHYQIEALGLDARLCHEAELLPPHHADPFDRMIIATAKTNHCPIFTVDENFARYPVKLIAYR